MLSRIQTNPTNTLTSYYFNLHFNIILPSTSSYFITFTYSTQSIYNVLMLYTGLSSTPEIKNIQNN